MSNFLGRLVERATGPPAVGLSPRLAPVFPIGRADRPQAEGETSLAKTSAALPATEGERTPSAGSPERGATVMPSPGLGELREIRVEHPPAESLPEQARVAEAQANEALRTEIRRHERTLERFTVQRADEPAQPPKAPALAAPRPTRVAVPVTRRSLESRRQEPRIEVRIGRVEVRSPPDPEPFEWQAPAADPPATASFGALAASRRYVDRRWS